MIFAERKINLFASGKTKCYISIQDKNRNQYGENKMQRSFFIKSLVVYFVSITALSVLAQTDKKTEPVISQQALKEKILLPTDIAAKVNGIPITKKDLTISVSAMTRTIKRAGQLTDDKKMPHDVMIKRCLDTLISSELIFQRAQKLGITVGKEELDTEIAVAQGDSSDEDFTRQLKLQGTTMETFRNSVLKTIYIRKVILQETPEINKPTKESDLRAFYNIYKNNLKRQEAVIKLSSITLKADKNTTPEELDNLIKKMNHVKELLDQGEDWNTLVEKYSSGPKLNGGNIGYFSRSESDIEIPGKIGEISDVITNLDGIHILKATDRKEKGGIMNFEEARPEVIKILRNQKIYSFVDKYIKDLKAKAHIETFID